jgi:hypothetical protein
MALVPAGVVIEAGSGYYSTPLLHEVCDVQGRLLVTVEHDDDWLDNFRTLETDRHKLIHLPDWKDFVPAVIDPLGGREIAVSFIDCWPERHRKELLAYFKDKAKLIVCHDAECRTTYPVPPESGFKYVRHYNIQMPNTVLLSDFVEL